MKYTSQLVTQIWALKKAQFSTLSQVHNDFVRWGGNCSYESFRQFAKEETQGSGELINDLTDYLETKKQ